MNKEFEGVNVHSSFTFGNDNGLVIAAAVSGPGNDWETGEDDPEIGVPKFLIKFWDDPTDTL